MTEILNTIQQNIEATIAIVGLFTTLILTIIASIKKIRDAYQQGASAMLDVVKVAVPAISEQEPKKDSNEEKNRVASQQIIDLVPDKTKKKLKLDSLISAGNVVSTIYSFVKPLIKR